MKYGIGITRTLLLDKGLILGSLVAASYYTLPPPGKIFRSLALHISIVSIHVQCILIYFDYSTVNYSS